MRGALVQISCPVAAALTGRTTPIAVASQGSLETMPPGGYGDTALDRERRF